MEIAIGDIGGEYELYYSHLLNRLIEIWNN